MGATSPEKFLFVISSSSHVDNTPFDSDKGAIAAVPEHLYGEDTGEAVP